MRTVSAALGAAAVGLWMSACGGGGGNSGNPTNPSGSTVPPDAIVINVVAINGEQSFSPNPSTVPEGRTVVWHNVDTSRHRIVLNDMSVDTGELAPGAFSGPMPLSTTGRYHCTIHPVMVGTLTR